MRRVYVYGASQSGVLACAACRLLDWEVLAVVDRVALRSDEERAFLPGFDLADAGRFFGLDVIPPDRATGPADAVLLATSPVHYDAAKSSLVPALAPETNIIGIYGPETRARTGPTACIRPESHGLLFAANKAGSQFVYKVANKVALGMGYSVFSVRNLGSGGVIARALLDQPGPALVTELGLPFDTLEAMREAGVEAQSLFIVRDPRDILVSYYHSLRRSHSPSPGLVEVRTLFKGLDDEQELWLTPERFEERMAPKLRQWMEYAAEGHQVFRFEDMIADNQDFFTRVFDHLGFPVSGNLLADCLEELSFERLAGRKQGQEDVNSHYRKGVSGQWTELPPDLLDAFTDRYADIIKGFGYA